MPSAFEPCGLSQMMAMRYGALPLVRETGGLKDTVEPYNQFTQEGDGFTFDHYNAHDMLGAIDRAAGLYYNRELWPKAVQIALACDFSWDRSAGEYVDLYREVLGQQAG